MENQPTATVRPRFRFQATQPLPPAQPTVQAPAAPAPLQLRPLLGAPSFRLGSPQPQAPPTTQPQPPPSPTLQPRPQPQPQPSPTLQPRPQPQPQLQPPPTIQPQPQPQPPPTIQPQPQPPTSPTIRPQPQPPSATQPQPQPPTTTQPPSATVIQPQLPQTIPFRSPTLAPTSTQPQPRSPPPPAPAPATVTTRFTSSTPASPRPSAPSTKASVSTTPQPSPKKVVRPSSASTQPSPRTTFQAPPPMQLPPAQLKPLTKDEEAEQKTVLVQEYEKKPMPTPGKDELLKKIGGATARSVPHSPSGEAGMMRVITLAGENKGAFMELGSPSSSNKKPIIVHSHNNGHLQQKKNNGNTPIDADSGNESGGKHGSKMEKDEKAAATPPMAAFVNSNVQSVNNSIIYSSSCTHKDPGVHLAVSRKPSSYSNGKAGHHLHQHRTGI